ncbi:MAG: hypothetical protein COC01_00020 [Bacteroidetes bacterium]|nr:MAG: hypothetical protein COC01_00020 [Bacteroidota bacterium]
MKRIFAILALIFLTLNIIAQNLVTISGKIVNPQSNEIKIIYINNFLEFKEVMAAASILKEEGKFGMTFEWNKPAPAILLHGDLAYRLFISPGDKIKVALDPKKFYESTVFEGKGAEVNTFLTKLDFKHHSGLAYEKYAGSFKDMKLDEFTAFIDKRKDDQLADFKEYYKDNIPSPAVDNYVKSMVTYSWATDKLNYLWMHTVHNNKKGFVEVKEDYYGFLKDAALQNEKALTTYYYVSFLEAYFDDLSYQQLDKKLKKQQEVSEVQYEILYDLIKNKLKGSVRELMLSKILYDGARDGLSEELKDKLEQFKTIYTNEDYLKILKEEYEVSDRLKPGAPAPNFKFPNAEGEHVSLSDFKGKVVYIEVWASWCAPCRAEIPYAKKLANNYFKDKEIVFLNVSIDTHAESWQKLIYKENMPGVHLLAGEHHDANIMELYNASGIPHYVLIDKDGKIIKNNCKSPSEGITKDITAALE